MHTGDMSQSYWGIVAVLVIGLAVIAYGYLDDRRRTRERNAALQAPPKRDIPGFRLEAPTPEYLSELMARRPPDEAATANDVATRLAKARDRLNTLSAALERAAAMPLGYPDDGFATDLTTKRAVITNPLVLVVADPVETIRELLPVIEHAKRADRPLVLVAPAIQAPVIDTLRANLVQRHFTSLPLITDNAVLREEIAAATGGTPVAADDLRSGYLPPTAFGQVPVWVATKNSSWVLESTQVSSETSDRAETDGPA